MNKSVADYVAVVLKMLNLYHIPHPSEFCLLLEDWEFINFECLLTGQYEGIGPGNSEVCEHIKFHEGLIKRDKKLFINPFMVNGGPGYEQKQMLWPKFSLKND